MTIKELIEELQDIEDQNQEIKIAVFNYDSISDKYETLLREPWVFHSKEDGIILTY